MNYGDCRICFQGPTGRRPLFQPCKCTGSMACVHQDCLLASQAGVDIDKLQCELCGTTMFYGNPWKIRASDLVKYHIHFKKYLLDFVTNVFTLLGAPVYLFALAIIVATDFWFSIRWPNVILEMLGYVAQIVMPGFAFKLETEQSFYQFYYQTLVAVIGYWLGLAFLRHGAMRVAREVRSSQAHHLKNKPPGRSQSSDLFDFPPIIDRTNRLLLQSLSLWRREDNDEAWGFGYAFSMVTMRNYLTFRIIFFGLRCICNAGLWGLRYVIPRFPTLESSGPYISGVFYWPLLIHICLAGSESKRVEDKLLVQSCRNVAAMIAATVLFPYLYGMGLYFAWTGGALVNPGFGTVQGWQFWLVGIAIYWLDRRRFDGQMKMLETRVFTGRHQTTTNQKIWAEHESQEHYDWLDLVPTWFITTLSHGVTVGVLKHVLFNSSGIVFNSSGIVQPLNSKLPDRSLLLLALATLGAPLSSGWPRSVFALIWLKDRMWLGLAASLMNPKTASPPSWLQPAVQHARFGVLCVVLGIVPLCLGRAAFSTFSESDLLLWTSGLALTLPVLGTVLLKYPPVALRQHPLMKISRREISTDKIGLNYYKLVAALVMVVLRFAQPDEYAAYLHWALPNFLLQLVLTVWPEHLAGLPGSCFLWMNYFSDGFLPLALASGQWSWIPSTVCRDSEDDLTDSIMCYIPYPGSLVDYRDLPESFKQAAA